ncbi:MAG: MBL fold metallo-hydrolase [Desulfurococcaceae archaeon]
MDDYIRGEQRVVRVTWHGHACISVTRSDGFTIVFDPHDGASIGLPRPNVSGDLVLVSHEHFDHNAVDVVLKRGGKALRMYVGKTDVGGVEVEGLMTFHDKQRGSRRGRNVVYVVSIEGVRIAHMGDLGHVPDDEVLSRISGVDLIAIPVGGTFTVEPAEAWEVVDKAKPKNVLPIHYWVRGSNLPLKPVDEFLKLVRGYEIVRLDKEYFDLPGPTNSVLVPRPPSA